jgi:hypothetical protein
MDCTRAEELFSERFENSLPPGDAQALEQHLSKCAACRAGYESFVVAVTSLRASQPVATSRGYAEQVSAAVFAAHAPLAAAPNRRWRRVAALVLSHAAALLLGWWGYLALNSRGASDNALAQLAPPVYVEVPVEKIVEKLVERVVEKPVEVLVEKRVEVPVEVIREVVKEVVVERVEYVDRPVPHPLQRDLDREQALHANLARVLHDSVRIARLASERQDAARTGSSEQPPVASARPDLGEVHSPAHAASMVVVREDGLVRIRTRGAPAEVIPALIAAVDGPDAEVSAAARSHLRSIQALLAQEGIGSARPPEAPESDSRANSTTSQSWWDNLRSGSRAAAAQPATNRARWQAWWNEHAVALADTRAH